MRIFFQNRNLCVVTFTYFVFFLVPGLAFGQAEKLGDIRYTPPNGWTKNAKDHAIVFSQIDQKAGKFCLITLYASSPSEGSPQKDFAREWKTRVVEPWGGEANPKTVTEPDNGWTAVAGGTQIDFQGNKAYAFLTVISGFGKTVSVLGILNDDLYLTPLQAFVEGMQVDKTVAASPAPVREEPRPAPAASSQVMNVNALAREFQDNEVRANQVWIGKRVRVVGVVNSIEIRRDGIIELTFKTSVTNYNMAKCFFSKSQSAGVANLNAHSEAVVEGTVRGLGGGFDNTKSFFMLENCFVP